MELESLSLIDLKNLAKDKGIPNYSKLKKSELIEKILENYLKLRSGFVNEEIEYLKIEAFFSKLAEEERIRNNIMFFLMNISTRPQNPISLAGKIYRKIGGKWNGKYESHYKKWTL